MEALIAVQRDLFGRIGRTVENLKKVGAAKITATLVKSTLQVLDKRWEKFETQHETLVRLYTGELELHDYTTNDLMGLAEGVYLEQRAALLECQAAAVKEADVKPAFSEATPPPRTTLPRIQLPSFSGKYEDWPPFRDLFRSLIVDDPSISDVTRLHYLKVSLKGEAESLIRSLATTDGNFTRAWEALMRYYENPRLLVRSYYTAYTTLPRMKSESVTELRRLFHAMTSTVGSLRSIGRPITNSEDLFVFLSVEMLDPRSRREWEDSIGGTTKPPTYEELHEFLERRHSRGSAVPED